MAIDANKSINQYVTFNCIFPVNLYEMNNNFYS